MIYSSGGFGTYIPLQEFVVEGSGEARKSTGLAHHPPTKPQPEVNKDKSPGENEICTPPPALSWVLDRKR